MILPTPRDRALRDAEQERCCDVLAQVPPDTPTLCEGWTAHDLAAHLWSLKQPDPRWWVGPGSRRRIADPRARPPKGWSSPKTSMRAFWSMPPTRTGSQPPVRSSSATRPPASASVSSTA